MRPKKEGFDAARLWRRLLGLCLVVLLGMAAGLDCAGGCDCGGEKVQIPLTPEEKLADFAAHLPAQTDLAFFFVDLEELRGTLTNLSAQFEGSLPLDVYRQEASQVIGIDLMDKASFQAAGVVPEGGAALGYYRGSPVVLVYAPDKLKFEAGVVASLKRNYRVTDEGIQKIPDMPGGVWISGKGVSFAYAPLPGGLVALVGQTQGEGSDCRKTLKEVVELEESSSLGASATFEGFKQEVGNKWPTSIYINTPRLLSIYKAFNPTLKAFQKEMLDAVAEQLRWTGVGGRADASKATGRIFFGVEKETLERFKGLDKANAKSPRFKMMVGEKAYGFLRSSVNADIFWREYYKLMPARQQRYFRTVVDNLKSTTSIDLEKDLVQNLTGHMGVAIYGLNPMAAMARRASQRMTLLTLAAHIQLKDPAAFSALMDRLVKELGGSLRQWRVPGGIVGYGFDPDSMTAPPFALYLKDDVVTLASTQLGDERVAGHLLGESPTLRRQLEEEGSVRLLEAEAATGLYINMPRVHEQIGILGGRMLNNLLGTPKDVSVLVSLAEGGISADGSVTFNKPSATETPAGAGAP